MEIKTIFLGVIAMLGYLLLQSLFILGVRAAAKGGTEKLPNGKDKDSEMILYPILKFLTRVKQVPVYYSGIELEKVLKRIKRIDKKINLTAKGEHIQFETNNEDIDSFVENLEDVLYQIDENIIFEYQQGNIFRLYKIDEQYVLSKYLRKPILQCPICMASFWSIFTYWIPMIYLFGTPVWLFYLGVADIAMLASLNWYIWVKGHAYEAKMIKH